MKKKIIIIISIIGIIALIGIGYTFRDDLLRFKRNIYPVHSVMKSEEKENELHNEASNDNLDSKKEEKNEIESIEEKIEDTKASINGPAKTNSNKTSASTKNTSQNTKETQKNNTPSSNNSGGLNSNAKQEEKPVVVQKQPWEELGLTEDQYKNQPMYSWEEVDFKTKDECMNYGNEHAEYGFECSEVTSWTRSLGWDYKTF